MSTPLLGFLLYHDNYIYECRVIQHHTDHCSGYCELKKELAGQDHKRAEFPGPALQKQLKVVDLLFESSQHIPPAKVYPHFKLFHYSSCLVYCQVEIETPPPRFLSI